MYTGTDLLLDTFHLYTSACQRVGGRGGGHKHWEGHELLSCSFSSIKIKVTEKYRHIYQKLFASLKKHLNT